MFPQRPNLWTSARLPVPNNRDGLPIRDFSSCESVDRLDRLFDICIYPIILRSRNSWSGYCVRAQRKPFWGAFDFGILWCRCHWLEFRLRHGLCPHLSYMLPRVDRALALHRYPSKKIYKISKRTETAKKKTTMRHDLRALAAGANFLFIFVFFFFTYLSDCLLV